MKKILVCALVLVMCLTAFVACNPTTGPDLTNLNAAKAYLETLYGEEAVDTSADYQRPARTPDPNNQGVYFDVAWSVAVTSGPATGVAVSEAVDGIVTINVDEFTEEDIVYTLTATVSDGNGNSVTATFNHKVPKFNSLTVAEFLAPEEGDDVYAIVGYVMASAANPGKTGSFVIADETGAIFSYNKFEINLGDKVVVWGNRSSKDGVPQINTTEVLVVEANSSEYAEATPTELNAADIDLDALSKEAMSTMSGKYYKINGVTLVKSGGYTNANYNDAQLLSLYTNDAIVAACADFYNCKVNVYGYVRGYSSGKYLTVQVTKIEWGEDYEFVPSTPETRVAYEKENLSLEPIASTGETKLPTTGSRYADTTIDWAIKGETTLATLENNVITVVALPTVNTEITLTATIKNGDVTDTKDVVVVIKKQRGALENKVTGAELTSFDALKALVPAGGDSTTEKYLTIGYVEEITSTKYGNMVISNADGKTLEIYGSYGHDGSKRFDALDVKPSVGDVVVLYGIMDNFYGTIQMKNAWIMQIETTVYGNVEAPAEAVTTIADALTAAVGTAAELSGTVVEITEAWSTYNNMSFYISDGTNKILVHRTGTQVGLGDVVSVVGEIGVYSNVNQIAQGSTTTVTTAHTCSTYTDATCTDPAECTVCGKENGAALGHTDEADSNGLCDRCGTNLEAAASEVTISTTISDYATTNSWTNSTKYTSITLDSVITVTATGGSNTGKYYTSGTNWRIYQSESPSVTITAIAGYEIVSVKITYTIDNKGVLTLNDTNVESGTAVDVNAGTISFGVGNTGSATNGQVRITAIEVVYRPVSE